MSPGQIKGKIQSAYQIANQNRHISHFRNSGIQYLLQDLKLFGRDAGIDFAETYIDEIVQEAIDVAKCNDKALLLQFHRSGKVALQAVAQSLRDATGLPAEINHQTITLTWADDTPRML